MSKTIDIFKKIAVISTLVLCIIAGISGCFSIQSHTSTTQLPTSETSSPVHAFSASNDHVNAFLQLAKDNGFDKLPQMYPDDTCYNITPKAIYEKTGCLVFKYDKSSETYLQSHGKIYTLGRNFGGYGLTDMQLCDFNQDGKFDLIYTFSWGSGIHRSQIGLFNLTTNEETMLNYGYMNGDMFLEQVTVKDYFVYSADVELKNGNFAELTISKQNKLAEIIAEGDNIKIIE